MMFKQYRLLAHSISCRFFAVFLMATVSWSASAQSSVWKVSKGADYFYLAGTIHLLNASDYPLPSEFQQAYDDAEEIIFETDLQAIASADFQQSFMQTMLYQDGRRLQSELSEDTYQQLQAFITSRGLSAVQFQHYQPWAVSLLLTMLEYQRLGMLAEYGVDQYYHQQAVTDNKQIGWLESPSAQLQAISAMSLADANETVNYTLQELGDLPQQMLLMKKSWRNGNVEAPSLTTPLIEMQQMFAPVQQALVTDRNNQWLKKLTSLTNDSNHEMVLVGTLHLSTDQGLLNLLKQAGFSVEPL